jgi:hypothetical protein
MTPEEQGLISAWLEINAVTKCETAAAHGAAHASSKKDWSHG